MRSPVRVFASCLTLVAFSGIAFADHWPAWRGATHNGISLETSAPTKWDASTNVAWKLDLPGPAGSTPVIWGDNIFLTSVDKDALVLMCVGTDGKQRWSKQISSGTNKKVRGDEGNYASPSAITDGTHVWTMMGDGELAAFTVSGEKVWHFNLQERYGKFKIQFGMSSTPVLSDGRLFVQLIHGEGKAATHEARVVALDALTGKEVWQKGRVTGAHTENEHSYASPMLYDHNGTKYLITHGGDYTIAYDLNNGEELWRLGGLNPHDDPNRRYHPTLRFVASPAAAEGIVVCPTAKRGPVFAIKGDQSGDLTDKSSALVWKMKANTPDVPSPLIHDGLVYLCRENGNLMCVDAKTGEQLYEERTERQRHRASPVYANGNIYLTARNGKVTVVKAGRKFEVVSVNDLGEETAASPAISNGTVYLRTFKTLWAIR